MASIQSVAAQNWTWAAERLQSNVSDPNKPACDVGTRNESSDKSRQAGRLLVWSIDVAATLKANMTVFSSLLFNTEAYCRDWA